MCESVLPQKSMVMSEYQTYLPSEVRVMTLLRQSETFSKAFGCKKSSDEQLCYLWD